MAFKEEDEIERRLKYLGDEKRYKYSVEINRIKSLDKKIKQITQWNKKLGNDQISK